MKIIKSCLLSVFQIAIIILAIGYEYGVDWLVSTVSAKSIMIGAIVAVFFNVYGSFEIETEIGIESEDSKNDKISKAKDALKRFERGANNGQFTKLVIILVFAIKVFISHGILGSIAGTIGSITQWVIAVALGILTLFVIMPIAYATQFLFYVILNWKKFSRKLKL